MKTCGPGKIPREDAILVQGGRNPAGDDTTSELCVRKCHAGCARYSANEWSCSQDNQGGTVEYFCIPPLIHSGGWDYFMPSPKPGNAKCKM